MKFDRESFFSSPETIVIVGAYESTAESETSAEYQMHFLIHKKHLTFHHRNLTRRQIDSYAPLSINHRSPHDRAEFLWC